MDIGNNLLSDTIPSSIGNLVNLIRLSLDSNRLSGSIPSSLGNLSKLRLLSLNKNRLSGTIPSTLGNLPYALHIDLSHNYFTFDGMELIAQKKPNTTHSPQANILIHQHSNTLAVSAGGTLSNNTYKWFSCNGTTSTLVARIKGDSVFHPTQNGKYLVRVKNSVATHLTLYSDSIVYIAAEEPVIASAENAFQQNDKTNLFRVYPNPAKDILHVETNGSAMFSLIDQSGKILVITSISGKGVVNISNITPGLYYLKNNSTGNVQKVVIVR